MAVTADDIVPLLRSLMDAVPVRRPYSGHPRIFIWGLLEARLQRADLVPQNGGCGVSRGARSFCHGSSM